MFKDSPDGQTQYEPAALEPVAWMKSDGAVCSKAFKMQPSPSPLAPLYDVPLYSAATVERLVQERDDYRAALEKLARLGNGGHYGNSLGNQISQEVLRQYTREEKP